VRRCRGYCARRSDRARFPAALQDRRRAGVRQIRRFVCRHQRLGDGFQIPIIVHKSLRQLGDERRRGFIGDKVAGELLCDVLGGRRVMRQVSEHSPALIDTALRIEPAEHRLLARLVQALVEEELAAVRRVGCVDRRPAGQHLGETCYVACE
jgi:hypothetical protein